MDKNKQTKPIIITIPDYPDKVMIAKARRPVFYVKENSSVRGRTNIPKSFLENKERYYFNRQGVLIERETGLPKLANPKTAGQPRFWVVNFQDIWNQNITKHERAAKVNKLKDILRPFISEISPITSYPLELSIVLYDTECNVDISNRGAVYTKVIEDLLVSEKKIPDDSVEYINSSGKIKFVRIEEKEEKKMEIIISKSDNNPL